MPWPTTYIEQINLPILQSLAQVSTTGMFWWRGNFCHSVRFPYKEHGSKVSIAIVPIVKGETMLFRRRKYCTIQVLTTDVGHCFLMEHKKATDEIMFDTVSVGGWDIAEKAIMAFLHNT